MKRSRLAAAASYSSKSPGLVLGSQPSSSQPLAKSSSAPTLKRADSDLFYDGLGGHSKPDAFPTLRRDPFKQLSKKPKGVARPKNCAQTKGQKLMDQFFSDLQ